MTSILQSQSSPAGSICKKGVCWPQRLTEHFHVYKEQTVVFPYRPKLYYMLVAMRAPQIAGLSCQGAHSHISLRNDTLLWNVSGKYSQSWQVCVCCWRTGSIWCTHIPVPYKYCILIHFEGHNILLRQYEWVVWTAIELGRSWRANFIFNRLFF